MWWYGVTMAAESDHRKGSVSQGSRISDIVNVEVTITEPWDGRHIESLWVDENGLAWLPVEWNTERQCYRMELVYAPQCTLQLFESVARRGSWWPLEEVEASLAELLDALDRVYGTSTTTPEEVEQASAEMASVLHDVEEARVGDSKPTRSMSIEEFLAEHKQPCGYCDYGNGPTGVGVMGGQCPRCHGTKVERIV